MTLLSNLTARLPLITLAAAAVLCGCNKEKLPKPELELKTQEISVSADGGTYSVGYEVKNPAQDATIKASAEVSWIKDFDYTESLIMFTAEPNPSKEEGREAEITVTYLDIVKTFKVIQPESSGYDQFTINIKVNSTSEISVNATFTPNDSEQSYYASAITKKDYEALAADRDLMESLADKFRTDAASYGLSLEEYLKGYVLKTGESTQDIAGLTSDTEYYVYAFGMNYEGAPTTSLFKAEAKTEQTSGPSGMTFELSTETNDNIVTMTAVPSDNESRYTFGYLAETYLEYLGVGIEDAVQRLIDDEIKYGTESGATIEEIIEYLSFFGPAAMKAEMQKGIKYYIYAAAISDHGVVLSDVAYIEFQLETETSDNVITLTISDITSFGAHLKVKTTNNDPYAIALANASSWSGLSDEQMAKAAIAAGLITERAGNFDKDITSLKAGTDYVVIAFGYSSGTITTGVTKQYFRTESASEPVDLDFTFLVENITPRGAKITVSATPEDNLYFWYAKPASMSESEIKAEYENIIQNYLASGMIANRLDYFRNAGSRGTDSAELMQLASDTDYRAFAIGINESDGSYSTPMAFSETFHTLKPVEVDIKVEAVIPHYYDCDEIIAAGYDNYAQGAGKALIELSAEVSGSAKCETYYFHMLTADVSDTSLYSDDTLIGVLLSYGFRNEKSIQAFAPFNKVCTLLAIGMDENGNTGKLSRKTITLTKDGVSDLSTFVPMQAPSILRTPQL